MKTFRAFSYWELDTFFKKYDLIVIGAGIVGLSTAYFAKKRNPNWRILVLERGFLPNGASTKNAGFSCFGSPTELLSDAKKESEEEIIKRIKWRWDGAQLLRKTIGDKNLQFDSCGGYELFESNQAIQESLDKLDLLNKWMFEATGNKDVFSEKPIHGKKAIFSRIEGAIHSGEMMNQWIKLNLELGNEIRFNTEVEYVESGMVRIQNGIELKTNHCLVATNGFASKLIDVGIKPARGLVFVSKELKSLKWKGTFHYDEGFVYFRNIGNRLLFGGGRNKDILGEQTMEMDENQTIKTYLFELANRLLEIDLNKEAEYAWAGIMGFSTTKSPVMKEIFPNVHIRAGLGGMGVAIGSEVGFEFAKLVTADLK